MDYRVEINELLKDPQKLKKKKPFTRGAKRDFSRAGDKYVEMGQMTDAFLPNYHYEVVTQEQFMREFDPNCHDVLFDDNIPSICVKIADGDYRDIKYRKMAIPFQRNIKNKQVMH